jgi:YVTN family beta-propeller protein
VRGLAAITALCAVCCFAAANAGAAPLAVVGNLESDNVSLIDTATNQPVGNPIDAGDGPASVAVAPDGRYAYVADVFGDTVAVISTATREPVGMPIPVGDGPFGLAVTPDGSRVFATDTFGTEASVIDTATKQVHPVLLDGNPEGVAVTPDGRFAYVTETLPAMLEGVIQVVDTETLAVVGDPIRVGEAPLGIEFTPDGKTAFVVDQAGNEVSAVDTATREVTPIRLEGGLGPRGIVVAPDGERAFVVNPQSNSVSVIDTGAARQVGEFEVGEQPQEIALSANGKVLYVTVAGFSTGARTAEVERLNSQTGAKLGATIELPGKYASGIALTPDQSPTAAFAVPSITAGVPAVFNGGISNDPDGPIASYSWDFGDGGLATGMRPTHTYRAPGTYSAKLSVVDAEGCGRDEVFTGRTAYCSGGDSVISHPMTVKAPVFDGPRPGPEEPRSNRLTIRRVVHNRRNGTVRLLVKLPDAGLVLLFGKKVHAVTRKSTGAQTIWLTIHARVELAKRLKKTHRARVWYRITFTPNRGTPSTVHRVVTLQRTPRHKQRRRGHRT